MEISIAIDFSVVPAGKDREDGDFTGERFRVELLVPALKKATVKRPVIICLNGTEGYGSSFIEGAFGGLISEDGYTHFELAQLLKIKANATYSRYKEQLLTCIADTEVSNKIN